MERELKDKVVVITGGAEGIGYNIADQYLQKGAKAVILLDINEAKGLNATETLKSKYGNNKAVFLKCDVTKDLEATSKIIFERYTTVDVLVNNAGIANEESLRNTMEINVIALIEWSMKFRERMRKDKGGKGGTIVNLASIYGYFVDPYMAYYKASKYAVMGFTKTLGHEENYKKTGVRIVAICPGYTYSALTAKTMVWEEQVKDFEAFTATKPWQEVGEVGKAAVEIFKVADSGTAWSIIGGAPIEKV